MSAPAKQPVKLFKGVKRPGAKGPMKKGPPKKAPGNNPGLNTIRAGLKRQSRVEGDPNDPQWLRVQRAIYGRFVEQRLVHGGHKVEINDVLADLADGRQLAKLLEVLSGEKYPGKLADKELGRIQAVNQVSDVLKWMEGTLKVDLKRCSPEDLLDKKDKAVFGMLFSVILKFVKLDDEDDTGGDVREALKLWFSQKTKGYEGVEIKDLKSSFYDGLALCALIHKMRPRLIPWAELKPGKDNAIHNLELALSKGEEFCNVPRILEPSDIPTLDEISMTVYLFDFYYGVALLQKQDVAARRLGKLVQMTKLHDEMRANYIAAATATLSWVDEKVAWLNGIEFDNTLAGIRKTMDEVSEYKAGEKATAIAKNLDNDALYNNLAVRLAQASRPAFAPAGQVPSDIEKKLEELDRVERETSVRMQKELARQLALDALNKRFEAGAKELEAWIGSERAYADAAETAEVTETAEANLYTHSLHSKDVKNARTVRLQDLTDLHTKLSEQNYEKKDAVQARHDEVSKAFADLEAALEAKKGVLDGDLVREQQKDDDACKEYATAVEEFANFCAAQKTEMQGSGDKELEEQLSLVDAQLATVQGADAKVEAIQAAQAAIDARSVISNPHTTTTVSDCRALKAQLVMLLEKKRELLQSRLEEQKNSGLTKEQVQEIADNFAFFDKDSTGFLDKKELRQCLASLGEDSTPADVDKILDEYDANKNGKISQEEFSAFMKVKMGDTNTEEEILSGWKYIALDNPAASEAQLRVLVNDVAWRDEHVEYLLSNPDVAFGDGLDYTAWTGAVFKR